MATDLETNEEFEIHRAPVFPTPPQNISKTYGMNLYALQMNSLPNQLRAKLPPTDSRFRPDIRAWEEAEMERA
jgi:hypothetical protein